MPDLIQSLQSSDLGHLRNVASLWGVELASTEMEAALTELAAALLAPALVDEVVDSLPAEVLAALKDLANEGGRIPWASFTRRFGEIRAAGPGRRDREQLYLQPISAAEVLFYRALLARAFFDTPNGPQEFAYIPDDLLLLLKRSPKSPDLGGIVRRLESSESVEPLGRPAAPKERARVIPANDRILDDACTLLAALRMGRTPPETPIPARVVMEFLLAAGIILASTSKEGKAGKGLPSRHTSRGGGGGVLQAEAAKSFLETPRPEALSMLIEAWRNSETFNELRLVPGLVCEGEWRNPSQSTRHTLLAYLSATPKGRWWHLPAFIHAIKEKHPDFQRPAGDYDSWFIRRAESDIYLRGFSHWDEIDGTLIRYFISGPLFWLGMVELATPEESEIVTAFRLTEKRGTSDENGRLVVLSTGRISVPRNVPRITRYLLSRFAEWEQEKPDEYRYRLSPHSLKKAKEQGLKVGHLLSLLAKNAAAEIPPAFVKALKRWEMHGTEARIENPVILRVSRPEVLEELRKSKAGRFLGEVLGPTAVIVKMGAQSKVLAALAEMGFLAEDDSTSG